MNKQDLIKKIKDLTDISNDEKAYLIELVNTKKKYGLVWEDKPEDVEEQLRSMLPVFKEVKERAIVAENPEAPNHILIEGDNLHALTALSYTHEGKVDVIYIDPPYNTGNKDFIYNDAYVDKEDTYRHSKWLSFMDKRLRLAKKLLSEKGVIFISIDDYEVSQLKLLCDEVFDANNFAGQWCWFKSATPPNLSHKIKKNLEYILVYEKQKNNTKYKGVMKVSKSDDPITKPQNSMKILTFAPNTLNIKIKDSVIKAGIYGTAKYPNKLLNDLVIKDGKNLNEVSFENRFVWTQPKLEEELSNNTIVNCSKSLVISYKKQNYSEEVPPNLIDSTVGVSTTEEAGKDLLEIFGEKVFDYPKPISLLKYLISFRSDLLSSGVILDFFAGTGTTLHATMALNAEDGGNRQCILVTNNENNIAEEVTYERNKRVIQGYTNAKGEQVEGLSNNTLRYYQADFVPSERTEMNRRLLTARSTELLCIKENCYIDKTKDFSINEKQAKLFTNGLGKYMGVVYHTRNQDEVIEQLSGIIADLDTTEKVKVYAFSPEKEIIEDDFYKVADKITAVPLPDSIYNAYRATFRTLKLDKKEAVSSTTNQEA